MRQSQSMSYKLVLLTIIPTTKQDRQISVNCCDFNEPASNVFSDCLVALAPSPAILFFFASHRDYYDKQFVVETFCSSFATEWNKF